VVVVVQVHVLSFLQETMAKPATAAINKIFFIVFFLVYNVANIKDIFG
jgi:hypothetical protein